MQTLADLADRLGVSTSTVSRALSGKPGVSDAVRRRVVDAAADLGVAPGSRPGPRGALVGVVVPELSTPSFGAVAQAVTTALVHAGHTPVLCSQSSPGVAEDEWVDLLRRRGATGLVVVSGMHADTRASTARYRRLVDDGIALVLVNGAVAGLGAPCLSVDDRRAARLAVDHLVALGHRQLGLVAGPARYTPVIRKVAGFQDALARHGLLAAGLHVEHSLFSPEGGAAAAARLLEAGVTGLVCASDLMALGAVAAVRTAGLEVPGDVSVVGFDDSALVEHTDPPLTTVRQPCAALGAAAAGALLETLEGGRPLGGELLFTPELVVRGSTAPAA